MRASMLICATPVVSCFDRLYTQLRKESSQDQEQAIADFVEKIGPISRKVSRLRVLLGQRLSHVSHGIRGSFPRLIGPTHSIYERQRPCLSSHVIRISCILNPVTQWTPREPPWDVQNARLLNASGSV